jgi:hypothetical protein
MGKFRSIEELQALGFVAAPEQGGSPGIGLSSEDADTVRRLIKDQKRESSQSAAASSLEPAHEQLPVDLRSAAAAAAAASAPSAEDRAAQTTIPIERELQSSPGATYSAPDAAAVSMSPATPARLHASDASPPMQHLLKSLSKSNERRQQSLNVIDAAAAAAAAGAVASTEEASPAPAFSVPENQELEEWAAAAAAAAPAAAGAVASAEEASPAPATDQPGDQPGYKTAFSLLDNQKLEELARSAYNIPDMQGDGEPDGAINEWSPPTGFGEPKYVTQCQLRHLTLAGETYKKEIEKMAELRQEKFKQDPP